MMKISKKSLSLLSGSSGSCLSKAKFGLERETLRVDSKGKISKNPHPISLGSALTHPLIKTDFAEPQLEYVTKAHRDIRETLKELELLHAYTVLRNPSELLWPFSMPSILPEGDKIPLAQYGSSSEGRKKTIYRRGLGNRYGRTMQTVSGVHFNFSFDNCLLEILSEVRYKKPLSKTTRSKIYFDTIRNFNRLSPTLIYLFGSSSIVDETYSLVHEIPHKSWKKRSFWSPKATSLRLSKIGYTSKVQKKFHIDTNSLEEYAKSMYRAVSLTYTGYSQYSLKPESQLNDHYLQLENEYYSLVRPKQVPKGEERVLEALMDRGVEYLEIRLLDNNPFHPTGVDIHSLYFLHSLLLLCLLAESSPTSKTEYVGHKKNQEKVSLNGRNKGIFILLEKERIPLLELLNFVLEEVKPIAHFLAGQYENEDYIIAYEMAKLRSKDENSLLTSQIEKKLEMQGREFVDLGLNLAREHFDSLQAYQWKDREISYLNHLSESSLFEQKQIENEEGSHDKKNQKPIILKPVNLLFGA